MHVEVAVGAGARRAAEVRRLTQHAVVDGRIESRPVRAADEAAVEEDVEDGVGIVVVGDPGSEPDVPRAAGPEPAEVGGRGERLHLDLEPDLREVLRDALRERRVGVRGDGVEHGLSASRVATGELARPVEVGLLERIDVLVAEPGHRGRQVLVGEAALEPAAARPAKRGAVDREVDRPPQLRIVPEEGARGVERVAAEAEAGREEELLLVDPVLRRQPALGVEVGRGEREAPVRRSGLDPVEHLVERARPQVDREAVDVVWPLPAVVAVAPDHDSLGGPVLGDGVRAGGGIGADALGIDGQRRRDGAGDVCASGEVGHWPRQPDDERVAACGESDDVREVRRPRRLHAECEHAVDRAREGACPHGGAVGEAEAASKRERVGLPVRRDARRRGGLRQSQARRVYEQRRREGVLECGVERADVQVAGDDADDAAALRCRRRALRVVVAQQQQRDRDPAEAERRSSRRRRWSSRSSSLRDGGYSSREAAQSHARRRRRSGRSRQQVVRQLEIVNAATFCSSCSTLEAPNSVKVMHGSRSALGKVWQRRATTSGVAQGRLSTDAAALAAAAVSESTEMA